MLWLFRDVLFFGQVYYVRDIHLVWHPQVEGFVRAIASGSWPVWNTSLAFGQPLLADPSAQILYPLTWLNLILRPWTYYTLYVVVHFVLAAMGMRALARHLGLSRAASLARRGRVRLLGPGARDARPVAPLRGGVPDAVGGARLRPRPRRRPARRRSLRAGRWRSRSSRDPPTSWP